MTGLGGAEWFWWELPKKEETQKSSKSASKGSGLNICSRGKKGPQLFRLVAMTDWMLKGWFKSFVIWPNSFWSKWAFWETVPSIMPIMNVLKTEVCISWFSAGSRQYIYYAWKQLLLKTFMSEPCISGSQTLGVWQSLPFLRGGERQRQQHKCHNCARAANKNIFFKHICGGSSPPEGPGSMQATSSILLQNQKWPFSLFTAVWWCGEPCRGARGHFRPSSEPVRPQASLKKSQQCN